MTILSKYEVIVVGNGVLASLLIFFLKATKRSCFQIIGESDYKFIPKYPKSEYPNLFENGYYGTPKKVGNKNLWGGMVSLPRYENLKADRLLNKSSITPKRYKNIKKIIEKLFGICINKKEFDGIFLSKWLSPFFRIVSSLIKPTSSVELDYGKTISIKEANDCSYLEYTSKGSSHTVYSKKIIICAGFFSTSLLKFHCNGLDQKAELKGTFGDHVSFFFDDPLNGHASIYLNNKWVSKCSVYSLKKEIVTNEGVCYVHVEPSHMACVADKRVKPLAPTSIITLFCRGPGILKIFKTISIGLLSLFRSVELKSDNYYLVVDVPIKKLWQFNLQNSCIVANLCVNEVEESRVKIQSILRKEYGHIKGVNWEKAMRIRVALHPYALKFHDTALNIEGGNIPSSRTILWLTSDNVDTDTADGHVGTLLVAAIDFIIRS
jgi:hypothetical protein